MTTNFENGLFIFRRDLRIIDNNGLNLLNDKCKNIYTIFIFTPEQVGNGNKYKSDNSVQFMIESLQDLASQISKAGGHLYTFYGHNDTVVADCIKAWNINLVCFNLDITPYAKERDAKIIKMCEHMKTYVHGGRQEAVKTLKTAVRTQSHYSKNHNDLDKQTTQLSAFIKFGCVSIREVYKTLRSKTDIIRQLIWRDFYANILYSFPRVLGHTLKPNYDKIHWHHNKTWFEKWCKGETGFPIVDAGMRQLNATGYMHNRARLIVASFLVKNLLIDWREGEEYFASKLTDYDVASNNGNWQWIASTGADSQPFFRIFNPWEQAKNYDPKCEYIKKWVPELKDVPDKDILKWETEWETHKDIKYPKPIVDYKKQKDLALKMLGAAFK